VSGPTDAARPGKPVPSTQTASDRPSPPRDLDAHERRRTDDDRGGTDYGRRDGPAYAALDLGTNNCRLLVARPSRRGFLVIDAFSRIIRLGEGVARTGRLTEVAMSRTLDALKVCASKLIRQKVQRSRLIATEACRAAENGPEFIERVRREVGLDLEIVSRETEARLAVAGCASLIDRNADLALVFDIGGGSSELIWLDLTGRQHAWRRSLSDRLEAQNCIAAWTSLPVGVVSLAERFGGRHVTPECFTAMVEYVFGMLVTFEAEHPFRPRLANSDVHLLGTSGTVTTIAGIHLGLERYDRSRVDGYWLPTTDVRAVVADLLAMDYQGRVAQPCVGSERADLVLAGCAILEALLRMWPVERLRVADRGLREGILATLMAEDGVYRAPRRSRGDGDSGAGSASRER
jgi:exopolyphosphatase / guanosine-5'-triphosphate,3'-diphosphate pyrophosphatase